MKPSEALKFSRPLWKHQADTLDRFAPENEAALLHEMGTGKTTSAIAWLRAKYNMRREVLPTLIVSPVATLYNWMEEIERNAPAKVYESAVVLEGSARKRIEILRDSEARIFVTNPEALDMAPLVAALREKVAGGVSITDEAHKFKGFPKSKRREALTSITDFCKHRMILTGTPILNSYLDLFGLWRILDRGETFGLNPYVFRERYFRDANIGWKGKPKYFPHYVPKADIEAEISAMISKKASRLKKTDCLTLPPLLNVVEHVELSPEQRSVYKQMEAELVAEVREGVCVASNALTRVLRMLQILSGYIQVETEGNEKVAVLLKNNPRLARLTELLEELTPNHKVIVWCSFQENYRTIAKVLRDREIPFAELTGQTKDRQAEIVRFQTDPKCRVMISNPQAGGVGVNLVAASYAIYYSRGYSLGDRLQSEARCHRGGSEIHEKITLIDLVAPGTLDEDVLSALLRKENFSENVLARLQSR